ncbi:MAG: protoporphyrinogen oxidase [Limisphaerales bacterium]|jgi:oxygen-dependent protoporphyrinogen oxidase
MDNSTGCEKTVAIVGAGITGLCAAYQLKKSGIKVKVFEASSRPGGVIRTMRDCEWLAEYGPNTLLETTPLLKQFFKDAGLEERKLYSNPEAKNRYIARYKRPIKLPSSPPAFFASELFTVSAKLNLLVEPLIGRGRGEESVAEFVKRRLGQEFLDYAIDPLVSGIYAGNPYKISLKHAFAKVYNLEARYGSLILGQIFGARERKKRGEISKADAPKVSFDDGLQVLTDTLAKHIKDSICYNCEVSELRRCADGWEVVLKGVDSVCAEKFSAVLITSTAYRAAKIRISHASNNADSTNRIDLTQLEEIEYPPVASVVLGYKRDEVEHPLDGFGVLVPRKEGFRILGTIFSSSLFPRRAPKGYVTLTTYLGGAQNPELALLPESELIKITAEDLKVLLGAKGKIEFSFVARYEKAIPQYNVGYGKYLKLIDEVESAAKGIFFAGHYRDGVSLSDSIHSGLKSADKIANYLHNKPIQH